MLLVDQWETISDPKSVLPALFKPKFDPAQKVYLEKESNLVPVPGKVKGSLKWRELSTEKISIDTEVSKDCILLITDNYSPGWRVKVSPKESSARLEVLPVDYFLMGIPLKAGEYHFLLEYRPWGFEVGKWVSLVSCIIYFALVYLAFRRRPFFP